ncbi:MAG: histidinol-phosphate transaminase, partial [Candidatus Omnitrophota bacterium]
MMFRKELEKIKPYQPGKPIEEVKRSLGLKEVYKLASNEIPFPPSYIKKAVLDELKNINRYPESGCFYLRNLLAKRLKVKESQIVFGNGSDEIIMLILRAIIGSGNDEVIISYPTFLMYEIQAKIQGAKVVVVPLKNLRYDLDSIAERVNKKTKLIFIANPDNPTGTYVNQKEVEKFLEKIPKDVLIYFDEAYFEFAPSDFPRSKEFLRKRGNIIIGRTFSKIYGLAGLRLGYCVTTEEIAGMLNKLRDPFNINRFAQVSAQAALGNEAFLKKVLFCVRKEKEYLYNELKKLDISYTESATNFILINFSKSVSGLCNYFIKNGVIVRDLTSWGLRNFFRVSIGLHKENKKFITCL